MSFRTFSEVVNTIPVSFGFAQFLHGLVALTNPHWYNVDKITSHIAQLSEEVATWYDHEQKLTNGKIELIEEEVRLLGDVHPRQPAALTLFRQMEGFKQNHLPFPGGLLDQPMVTMLELKTVKELEEAHLINYKVGDNAQ